MLKRKPVHNSAHLAEEGYDVQLSYVLTKLINKLQGISLFPKMHRSKN